MKSNRPRAAPLSIASASPMMGRRDSDASLCSSRPSSAGGRSAHQALLPLLSDRGSQSSALRSINSYLSSISATFCLKPPLPSARDISLCLRLLLSRLHYDLPSSSSFNNHQQLDEDLLLILKLLGCPIKLNRSALKAPGTPHSWPSLLSVLFWLFQLARYADHHFSSCLPTHRATNDVLTFTMQGYSLFITGEDDAEKDLEQRYIHELEAADSSAVNSVGEIEMEASELEERVRGLKSGPSRKETLERERAVLVEDARKFESVVESFKEQVGAMERKLGDFEKELEVKEMEGRRIAQENDELRKRIEGQAVNVRDVERMRREMQAVESDVAESESARNALEEKVWEIDAEIERKWKDTEALAEQGNQAMRKLKLGDDLQYVLNPRGSTPAEVMGIDYKNILKPSIAALSEEIQKASVSKLDELMALRQQSRKNASILEEKRHFLAALESKVNEGEARLNSMKNEIEDYASKCVIEAENLTDDFMRKQQQLRILEMEAEEYLKNSEQKLQFATGKMDEEIQICVLEYLMLIDSISEYKEFMESLKSKMKSDVMELAKLVSENKASAISAKMASFDFNRSLKRARCPAGPI